MLHTHCRFCLLAGLATATLIASGCAKASRSKQFVENGPSTEVAWPSPTALDVYENFEAGAPRTREWPALTLTTADGRVTHPPLWMENPFVAGGTKREDADPLGMSPGGRNKYRLGGTDIFAGFYMLPRFWANLLMMPVSMVPQPPWEIRESDGYVREDWNWAFGYDAEEAEPTTPNVSENHHQPHLYGVPADADTEGERPHPKFESAPALPAKSVGTMSPA